MIGQMYQIDLDGEEVLRIPIKNYQHGGQYKELYYFDYKDGIIGFFAENREDAFERVEMIIRTNIKDLSRYIKKKERKMILNPGIGSTEVLQMQKDKLKDFNSLLRDRPDWQIYTIPEELVFKINDADFRML